MSAQSTSEVHTSWTKDISAKGEFVRTARTFRSSVTADGSSGFKAEPNRYHLYVSLACPWAHRTLILRKLKGLEHIISVDIVDHFLDRSTGWSLLGKSPDSTVDTVNGFSYLREVYLQSDPDYSSSFTVPVLYDKHNKVIVNNESSEIIRMFNSEFNEFATNKELDLYPPHLRSKIDEINSWVYPNINDGVYKCGFARTQEAYETAFHNLFNALDKLESILSETRYVTGDQLTEADVRLFTTLVRFDAVYVGHFKANLKRIVDYPNIWNYLLDLYQTRGFGETVNMFHIKHHYYESHRSINPLGIVPVGPAIDFSHKHNREDKFPKKK